MRAAAGIGRRGTHRTMTTTCRLPRLLPAAPRATSTRGIGAAAAAPSPPPAIQLYEPAQQKVLHRRVARGRNRPNGLGAAGAPRLWTPASPAAAAGLFLVSRVK